MSLLSNTHQPSPSKIGNKHFYSFSLFGFTLSEGFATKQRKNDEASERRRTSSDILRTTRVQFWNFSPSATTPHWAEVPPRATAGVLVECAPPPSSLLFTLLRKPRLESERKKGGEAGGIKRGRHSLNPHSPRREETLSPKAGEVGGWAGLGWAGLGEEKCKTQVEDMPGQFSFLQGLFFFFFFNLMK